MKKLNSEALPLTRRGGFSAVYEYEGQAPAHHSRVLQLGTKPGLPAIESEQAGLLVSACFLRAHLTTIYPGH